MLDLSRWQFAFTVAFHMTFPAITVGMSIFIAYVYGMWMKTDNPAYLQLFRFWKRIFAVGFALGVVAGTVITFEFGLNWGPFAHATGPILGPIIGMEVVTAFFVEAGFIGVLLYGDGRVKPRTIFISSIIVAIGTILSTTWIIVANSWMQTPAGFEIVDGQYVPADWWQIIFNPSFGWRYPHMLLAVLIAAGWFIAGLSAYQLYHRDKFPDAVRGATRALSLSLGVVAVLLPAQIWIGDQVAFEYVAPHQIAKLQAMEGFWHTDSNGYNVFVIPDQEQQRNLVQLEIPYLGSMIAKDLSGGGLTPGLTETPVDEQPHMAFVFWGFRVMFYASMVMFATSLIGVVLRLKKKLFTTRWFHKLLMWVTPLGVIAIIGGWVTAETGRQPYLVYGHMRTVDGVSHLETWQLVSSVIGFMIVYFALFAAWVMYVIRQVRRGPRPEDSEPLEAPAEVEPEDAL